MRLPWPEYVPVGEAGRVARWVAEKRRLGTPALLSTTASSGVRAAAAAEALGLDISGALFRLGGEPFTAAKAEAIARTGARAVSNYSMSELGRVGVACASPAALDDLHVTIDHLAVIQRDRLVGTEASVPALLYTTLRPNAPKLMLNVESDDYGTLVQRECGCLLGELGFSTHVHSVRSYEKLTQRRHDLRGERRLQAPGRGAAGPFRRAADGLSARGGGGGRLCKGRHRRQPGGRRAGRTSRDRDGAGRAERRAGLQGNDGRRLAWRGHAPRRAIESPTRPLQARSCRFT